MLINIPLKDLPEPSETEDILINNVSIVDLENKRIRRNENLFIQEGIIITVTNTKLDSLYPESRIIDATGKYLIPGLINMHAHTIKYSPRLHFPLMIANGVTGFRDMGLYNENRSADFFTHSLDKEKWNQSIRRGELTGPIMYSVASNVIETRSDMEYVIENVDPSIPDSTLINDFFKRSQDEGADFIKIQIEGEEGDLFELLSNYSIRYNLKLNGHAPGETDLLLSVKKMGSLEHARALLNDAAKNKNVLNKNGSYGMRLGNIANAVDSERLQSVLDTMSAYGTAYVPTHLTRKWEARLDDESFLNDERMDYVPLLQKLMWKIDQRMMIELDGTRKGRKGFLDFYKKGLEVTKSAHDAQVLIMAGTDALDSYIFYGFSMHDELQEMVKSGLSAYEALETATINPAIFLNQNEYSGSILEGKQADFVLLNNNPVDDIRHSSDIFGVIQHGRYYDKQDIERLKNFSRNEASSLVLNAKMIWSLVKDLLAN